MTFIIFFCMYYVDCSFLLVGFILVCSFCVLVFHLLKLKLQIVSVYMVFNLSWIYNALRAIVA